ncbi:hypothetical protein QYE76_047913 [Lolium multiflorum]|uniref:Uncharacterized protein n=1 Tax=Lolium multiflorum TaxID=4521 RepID=A0AAD8TPN8_LOLMU|nr:hypothetical protein QYE76_047913 [Lolium multiflorum]
MCLQLGQVDAFIISSPAAAQEVLRNNNVNFASRPSILALEVSCYGNLDIAFSPYGEYWRMLGKLCTMKLLSARKVRQFAAIRDSKTMSMVQTISDTGKGGNPVNMGKLLMSCANTITAHATFGEGCEGDLQERFFSRLASHPSMISSKTALTCRCARQSRLFTPLTESKKPRTGKRSLKQSPPLWSSNTWIADNDSQNDTLLF